MISEKYMSEFEQKNIVKIGIIGTGRIAKRFLEDSILVEDVSIASVYNPHEGRAAEFVGCGSGASNMDADRQEIIPCDDFDWFMSLVDAVYIATPHETHYGYVMKCLENGKHVLCEKPMTLDLAQAVECYNLARSKGLVLREAIKTSYCEGFNKIIEVVKSGKIGRVHDVEAAFSKLTPTNTREFLSVQCGGSVTELGSYVLLPILRILGCDYRDVSFQSILAGNGVDSYTKIQLTYDDALATGKTGLGVKTEGQLLISGTKGYILAESPWWLTKHFQVRYEDASRIEDYTCEYERSGLQYELAAFVAEILDVRAETERGVSDVNSVIDRWFEGIGITEAESVAIAGIMEIYLAEYKINRVLPEMENSIDEVYQVCDKKAVGIWAHRGCSNAYPENTLEAFEAAAKLPGIKGIELDVQFTSDGEIVVFHDEKLDRVTDILEKKRDTNERGTALREYSLAELKTLRVAPKTERETTIPTLDEVLNLLKPYCENNGLLINIELKTSVIRYEGIEQATYDLVEKYGLQKYIVYSSFLEESVALMKEIDPSVRTGMLSSSLADSEDMGIRANADALHPAIGGLQESVGTNWLDKPVRAWNGEEPFYYNDKRVLKDIDLRDYAAFGVTDIITNVPERYLRCKS